jgi:hypothetical protein
MFWEDGPAEVAIWVRFLAAAAQVSPGNVPAAE